MRSLIKSTYYIVLNPSNILLHIFTDSSILKNWNKVPRWKWWPTKITSIKKLREPKQCSKRNGWMLFMTSTKIVKKRDSYHQKTEWHPFWGKDLSKSLGMASLFWFLILPKMNNSVQYLLCPHQGLINFFIFRCLRIQMTISLQNLTLASIKDFDKFVTTLNSPNLNSQRAGFSMSLKLINNEIVFSPK